ncbi:hypothetical protein Baya_0816 [Bagarius yarrelli]|uniref:Uncharacterized protein n=1 Tax=Bagarius yarrelli TaxID=175774 RepID=A0A556TJC0_BAGYA|nr:hypothetical protein Baya_0816 [Bagarius yarrelli]
MSRKQADLFRFRDTREARRRRGETKSSQELMEPEEQTLELKKEAQEINDIGIITSVEVKRYVLMDHVDVTKTIGVQTAVILA